MNKSAVLMLALLCASGAAWAQDAMTEAKVRAKLTEQGYTKINDVKFEDGVWKADARSADGDVRGFAAPKRYYRHPLSGLRMH